MGVKLTPLLAPAVIKVSDLAGKKIVVDGCNLLFRYITTIRKGEEILYNAQGEPVSHLIGIFYFIINLLERRIRPIFVFDGYPPEEKRPKSPLKIQRLINLWQVYAKQEQPHKALFRDPLFLYDKIIADLQEFVRLLGCPVIRGLSEGELQGAALVREKHAYGMISNDQDSLLYGCPRTFKKLDFKEDTCIYYDLPVQLTRLQLTQRQLVDLALLMGTDFNEGIKGIGPKKAWHLIQQYGQIEDIPDFSFPFDIDRLRTLFLHPVTLHTTPQFRAPNTNQLTYYLKTKGFNSQRIERGISRLRSSFKGLPFKQAKLTAF